MGFHRVQKRPLPINRERSFVFQVRFCLFESCYEIHGISHTGSLRFLLRNRNSCQCKELLFRQNFMRDERAIPE